MTIPETHRRAVISWLRTLRGRVNSVRLTWEKPGHLTLTHREYDTIDATISVPVTIEGKPPVIAFDSEYLADALKIGATLRLVDSLNPGMGKLPLLTPATPPHCHPCAGGRRHHARSWQALRPQG